MLYYLFTWLDKMYDFPGAGVFNYISFRAAMAILVSLIISLILGKRIIKYLLKKQVGETVRDLGLDGQKEKEGTPTMGGLMILAAIIIPTLLFARLENVYVILMLITTVWLGAIGFIDDYIKVFKKDKAGLHGKFKVMGQIGLGIIVGCTLYFNDSVKVRERVGEKSKKMLDISNSPDKTNDGCIEIGFPEFSKTETQSLKTTVPFVKNNEFDYSDLLGFL
ncbi:MAG: phospho-N-acetylmuramoyl-pentapeptide-transferase, partial [Bacteroidia bacterium]